MGEGRFGGVLFAGEHGFAEEHPSDADSIEAFAHLVAQLQAWGYRLIDCQVQTDHLVSLGARSIRRTEFNALLDRYCVLPGREGAWTMDLETYPWDPDTA